MAESRNDMTPSAAAAALAWLAEMGADEIVGDAPVDRFAVARKPEPVVAQPPAPVVLSAAPPGSGLRRNDGNMDLADCRTLADVEALLRNFDACPLKKTATNLCYYDGNPQAHVMLVGEAPGREEDEQGKPFVGKSGQLLDRMLAAIGLSRKAEEPDKAVFITNTIFWRPPGNRDPTEAETAMCLPFLRRTMELQQPRVIVCIGKIPSQRLLASTEGILKLRGRWRDIDVGGRKVPLLPTLHPAYLLRQPAQKRLSWRDLLSLRQALDAH